MSVSRLILDHCFFGNSFIGRRELHDFSKSQCFYDNIVFFGDFPVITASYFITKGISFFSSRIAFCDVPRGSVLGPLVFRQTRETQTKKKTSN